jgi:DHA3 family multidrug efflux protein-like MFS transporter
MYRRTFRHALANTLVASVVNYTVWFAVTFWVYLETHSVFATGVIAGIFLTFTALSGMWFGSFVDHHAKRTVMIVSSAGSLVSYALAFAGYLLAGPEPFRDAGSPVLWAFVLLLMVGVIAGNLRGIAMSTTVTLLVPEGERDRANGLVGTASGVSFLITSVLSGLLVGLSGMTAVLVVALVATAAAIAHLAALRFPNDVPVAVAEGERRRMDLRGTVALVAGVPGLAALIAFTTINNVLGGVFMALMDPYGLSLVSVEVWGVLWGVLSTGMIIGGVVVSRRGLGRNPLRAMLLANVVIWSICSVFTMRSSIMLLAVGMFLFLLVMPVTEAAEQTVLQKVVPFERQGRVFGFAQSVEQAASPLTAFLVSPVAQFVTIPFMTTGAGVELLGPWFGVGPERGMALLFTVAGLIGLVVTVLALGSRAYRQLSARYQVGAELPLAAEPVPCPA